MKKGKKNHLSGQCSKGCTGTEHSGTGTTLVLSTGTGTHCSILTSVRIVIITWLFLIRFE